MIEPLRNAVLHSKCNQEGEDVDESVEDAVSFNMFLTLYIQGFVILTLFIMNK